MTDEEVRALWGSLKGNHSLLAKGIDEGFYVPPTKRPVEELSSVGEGETEEPFSAPLFPEEEKAERPHTWFEDISRWWENRNKGGSPFDTAAAAEKLKADEETTIDEATDYEFLDVGKVVSGIGNTIKNTQLYTAHVYNMKGEEYLERCHEIQDKLGVNATTLSQDAFDKAWKLTQEVKQKEKLAGVTDANGHVDMDKLYEAMPYLETIHEAHGDAGVLLAMNNAPGLLAINDVYDDEASRLVESILAGLERGGLQFKRQLVGLQALTRGLSSDEGLTTEEVQTILDNAKAMENLPQYSYSSAGGAIGGVLGSAAENLPIMLTSMVAGQAHPAAAVALMAAEVAGGNYIEEISKTDENGKPIYTPRESAIMAVAKGLPEAILEEYKFSQMGKAILGKGAAKKLSSLYAKRGAEIAGRESLEAATREIVEERVKSMVRAGILSGKEELTEEFNQAWTTAVVDNILQSAFRGDKADLKSADDILVESFENAAEAVPAVVGFGLMGAAGNAAVNTQSVLAFRERFRRAQGSKLWKEAYENQYREGVIDSVGASLGEIEELNGKHPDMVKDILDAENEKNGVKETDVDLRALMQTSPEMATQIAQAAGKSQEEIDACLNGTGIMTVDTSILQQASYKMTPEQKAAINGNLASVGGMTTKQIADYAKYLGEALKAVEVEQVQQEAAAVENFVNTTFDKADRETALDIIAANTENPALEVRNRQREVQGLLDEIFAPVLEGLRSGMKRGVDLIRETDERGMATGDIKGRVSNNAPWYRNFYADYGRGPTEEDLELIAYENLIGTATRYADGTISLNDGSPEVQEYFATVKAEIDGLWEERDRLSRMADVFSGYKSGEFMAQAAMPEGAREAYQSIYDALKTSGVRSVSTNARVNAILAARIAERVAQSYRESGQDVKAKDILPQILGGAEVTEDGLRQFAGVNAMTADTLQLDLAKEYEALGSTPEDIYKATGWLKGKDGKWRFVIKDKLDNIDFGVLNGKRYAKLSKVYDNPELYRAYPWLADIKVLLSQMAKETRGFYSLGRDVIELNKDILSEEPEVIKRTLVHEIQHAIQYREGFAVGGSPEGVRFRIEREISELSDERERLSDEEKEYLSLRNIITDATLGIVEKSDDEIMRLREKANDIREAIPEEDREKASRIDSRIKHLKRVLEESKKNPYKTYFNLGGEQEARETSRIAGAQQGLDRALKIKEEAIAEGDNSKFRKARLEEEYFGRKVNELPQPHNINAIVIFDGKETAYRPAQNVEAALDGFLQAAWHGSPHRFTKFDLGAIGTGEGAQVHGWGLYFAQDRKVAENYKDVLERNYVNYNGERIIDTGAGGVWASESGKEYERNTPEAVLFTALKYANGDIDKVKADFQEMFDDTKYDSSRRQIHNLYASVLRLLNEQSLEWGIEGGSLFQVEIPDSDVLLDEQKTFEEQPKKVQDALKKAQSGMGFWFPLGGLTGREIYKRISDHFGYRGNDREASEILNQYGIEGITYEGGMDGRCFVVFDDAAINIIDTYNQQANATGERVVRGQYSPMRNIVSLFKEADQSTFMHEMAHFYLTELGNIAAINPDGQAAKDLATVNEWAEWHKGDAEAFAGTILADEFAAYEKAILEAEKNGTAKIGGREYTKDELLDTWRQEKFARAFEGYLREGKAPTSTLKKIFRSFKQWLMKIYGDIIGAGVKPSAEIEAVMARMVATDEEIEAQYVMKDANDVAKVDPDLLNGDTEAMRQRWITEAKEEAKEKLLKELLKEQAEKDIDAHMEAFEESERERLAKDPAFAVVEMMEQYGMTAEEAAAVAEYNSVEAWRQDLEAKGGSFDAALSASLEAERDRYTREMPNQEHISQLAEEALASSEYAGRLTALEAEAMKRREQKYANAPKRLLIALRDLTDALEVLESDDPLQAALLKLKYAHRWEDKQAKQIEAMQATIDSMKEAAQEDKAKLRKKLEGQIKKLKDATVQNAEWLRGVRDAANGTYRMTRDAAKTRLLSLPVKDATNTRRWINEARKAERESATTLAKATRKGDEKSYEAAKQAKMRQSFYEAMAAESLNLRRELQRIQNDMKRVQRGLVNAKGEIDASTRYYLGHIQYMLGFRGKDALTPQSLKDFNALFNSFKSNAETGNIGDIDGDVSVPQWLYKLIVSENQPPSKYRDYTVEELQDMRRLVDMLYRVAKNKNRMLSESFEGKQVAEVKGELYDEFQKTVTVNKGDEGLSEPFTNILMPAVMLKTLGPSWKKYIYNPLLDGWEKQERLFMQAAEDLNKLFEKYWKKPATRRDMRNKELSVTLPDGTHITKENVLAMAMNWGNEGNRLRLCNGIKVDGAPASERDIEDIFRQVLTAKDWEFVQEAWDYINSYGDPVNDVVEKLTGSPMIRIQPQPFTVETSDGQTVNLRGGYYPAVYDPKKSTRKEEQDIVTAAQAAGAMVFGTGMGSTKARSAEGLKGSPLDLSMDVLFRHVNQQIHIAALRIPCRDVYKLLQNDEIRDMVESSIGRNAYLELKRWCENVWQEPIKKMLWYERLAEAGRRNTVQAIMAFRASVAALNFANPALMARELGIRDTALALLDYLTSGNREWVLEESPFLKNRANNIDRDIRQAQKESFAPEGPIKRTITRTSGWMIEQTDMLFSLPTYRWVYKQTFNKAIEQGATEKEAKKEAHYAAEDKVRKIFGSAAVIDQSAVQRTKSPFMKALTPFYTYTSTQANAVFEEYLKARYQGSDVKITDTGEIEAKRKSFMNRWGTMIHAVLYTYLVETLVEQAIRDGIGYLTRGDDDEPWSFEAFKKRWLVQSLTTFTSAIPAVNVAGELLGQQILGERYGARGFGIMSAAQERVLKVEADVAKALQGKGDTIEIGRDVAKAVNTFTGYPDTLTDAVFNLARAYNENFSGREVFWKTIFDKRLKPKKAKKTKRRKTKKKE